METTMRDSNIILTGLPRSGTTLTCHLLNKLPDTVALHEPMTVSEFPKLRDSSAICGEIDRFFEATRKSLLKNRTALSKHAQGKVPDNPFPDKYSRSGLRLGRAAAVSKITIDKDLSEDFLLIIKHPAAFTALLPVLVERFRCFAVIRNPVSVLSSWNSIAVPVENGHAPAAENLDPGLKSSLSLLDDKFDRQLFLLSWFFDRYRTFLPEDRIIRYENTIASRGANLTVITEKAAALREPLENKNKNKIYNRDMMHRIAEKLLSSEGAYWDFYDKSQVEKLLD
jgi:hypothetical protein